MEEMVKKRTENETEKCQTLLYKTVALSHLDYCGQLWTPILQRMQWN